MRFWCWTEELVTLPPYMAPVGGFDVVGVYGDGVPEDMDGKIPVGYGDPYGYWFDVLPLAFDAKILAYGELYIWLSNISSFSMAEDDPY